MGRVPRGVDQQGQGVKIKGCIVYGTSLRVHAGASFGAQLAKAVCSSTNSGPAGWVGHSAAPALVVPSGAPLPATPASQSGRIRLLSTWFWGIFFRVVGSISEAEKNFEALAAVFYRARHRFCSPPPRTANSCAFPTSCAQAEQGTDRHLNSPKFRLAILSRSLAISSPLHPLPKLASTRCTIKMPFTPVACYGLEVPPGGMLIPAQQEFPASVSVLINALLSLRAVDCMAQLHGRDLRMQHPTSYATLLGY